MRMSKPVGVIASAIVVILGSFVALLMAAASIAGLFIQATQPQPPNSVPFVLLGAAMMAALAGIGTWTSVGLFRLRAWARMSILVFAGFLALCSIFGLLMIMVVPVPPNVSAGAEHTVRWIMVAAFGIPLAIAVWWLIQFNTRSTKAAFSSPSVEFPSPRPLSISIIAWSTIFGGASCLVAILARAPAFWFGATLDGWAAVLSYALVAALSLYIGKGLLDLRERARLVAIGWIGFSFFHFSLVSLVPSLRQKMLESERAFTRSQNPAIAVDQGMMINLIFAFAAITAAAAIWFLMRNRAAFVRAEIH